MRITIKAKDLDLTEPLKQYVEEKIGGLEKFISKIEEQGEVLCEVEVSRSTKHHHKGDVFYAEANLHLPGGHLRAEDQDYDARVAIDKVRNRLQRSVRKFKIKHLLTGKALRHMVGRIRKKQGSN